MRDHDQLVKIIKSQADLIEQLVRMLNQPLYLWLHSEKRWEITDSSTTAVLAARRVVAEETTTLAHSSAPPYDQESE